MTEETAVDGMIELDDGIWEKIQRREETGFIYGVTSMGIYCRARCPARTPLRRNIRLFRCWQDAEAAGFRACKRCDPKGERAAAAAAAVQKAVAMIEAAEDMPGLDRLAAHAGFSRYYFLRVFKQYTGVTPRSYAEGVKARRLQAALARGERVADAVAAAGFGSESRVYEDTSRHLGMRPGAARRGGAGETIRTAFGDGPFGRVLVGATDTGVCYLGFAEPDDGLMGDLRRRFPNARIVADDTGLADTLRAVLDFLREPRAALDLPLDLRGTAFQKRVWDALRTIPPGQTRTYAQVAAMLGAPKAVRAVARSCATNPVSLAVPCHRVVGSNGSLTGYRWGIPQKRELLAREAEEAGQAAVAPTRP